MIGRPLRGCNPSRPTRPVRSALRTQRAITHGSRPLLTGLKVLHPRSQHARSRRRVVGHGACLPGSCARSVFLVVLAAVRCPLPVSGREDCNWAAVGVGDGEMPVVNVHHLSRLKNISIVHSDHDDRLASGECLGHIRDTAPRRSHHPPPLVSPVAVSSSEGSRPRTRRLTSSGESPELTTLVTSRSLRWSLFNWSTDGQARSKTVAGTWGHSDGLATVAAAQGGQGREPIDPNIPRSTGRAPCTLRDHRRCQAPRGRPLAFGCGSRTHPCPSRRGIRCDRMS